MESNYSLSDIAAATGNDGFGGGMGGWWMIILFALIFNGGGLFGGNNRAATVDELSAGFANSAVLNKLNDLTVGQENINQNLGNAICQLGYRSLEQTSALSSQMASCCCDLKTAIHAEGEATRNMIQQNKIESLQAQINQLQLAQATCGLPRINQYAWGVYPYTCGCTNGCTNI